MEPPSKELLTFLRRQFTRLDSRTQAFLSKYSEVESKVASKIMESLLTGRLITLKERRRRASEIQALLRTLYAHNERHSGNLITQYFQTGQRAAQMGTGEKVLTSQAQSQALKILTENLVYSLDSATTTIGRRVEDTFRKEGLRAAIAKTTGQDQDVASKTMRDALVRDGVTSFIDVAGRRWTLEHYSKVATHTVTQEAYNSAMKMSLLEKDFDIVQVSKSSKPCPECIEWDGEIVSLSGRSKDYRKAPKFPIHPLCEHYIMPIPLTISERAEAQKIAA